MDTISAPINGQSDSESYLVAYENFYRQKIDLNYPPENEKYIADSTTFLLYDRNRKEISKTVSFPTLELLKLEIRRGIDANIQSVMNLLAEQDVADSLREVMIKKNAGKIAKLRRYFDAVACNNDNNCAQYFPKTANRDKTRTDLFCYVQDDENGITLKIRIQQVVISVSELMSIQLEIDNKPYEFVIDKPRITKLAGGYSSVWFDRPVIKSADVSLVRAIAAAKKVRLKFISEDELNDRYLTPEDIEGIVHTIQLYNALGGHM